MQWDRFDICEAYYCYAMLWHGGQWSKEYAIFGRLNRMGFNMRPMFHDENSLTDNARAIYNSLVESKGTKIRAI